MPKMSVRVLDDDDWARYREIRLAALQDAPDAFLSSFEQEQQYDEARWRSEVRDRRPLVAERAERLIGVATLRATDGEPDAADVAGLWVVPEVRHTGVAMRLIEFAAAMAAEEGATKLYYWVGSENGSAIGFALNAGFRATSQRRTAPVRHPEFGDQEIALVLSLAGDPAAVPNASERSLRRAG
ncbi:MAG: GNAT family N-acetyltransferase [Friedmanniella sp.]|jgi:GNAT superfamily N-acetyltransferase